MVISASETFDSFDRVIVMKWKQHEKANLAWFLFFIDFYICAKLYFVDALPHRGNLGAKESLREFVPATSRIGVYLIFELPFFLLPYGLPIWVWPIVEWFQTPARLCAPLLQISSASNLPSSNLFYLSEEIRHADCFLIEECIYKLCILPLTFKPWSFYRWYL